MRQFNISGMSCAACSARVEKAVSSVDGVIQCSVNLLTNSMTVDGKASDSEIIRAVTDAGYGAKRRTSPLTQDIIDNSGDISSLKKRLVCSLLFLLLLMYISMGRTMFGLPLPAFLSDRPSVVAFMQFILAFIIIVINRHFYISGFRAVKNKSANMDTLVSLGSASGFIYSLYMLCKITVLSQTGNIKEAFILIDGLYFDSSAMILVLITVGKTLEAHSKGRTTDALKNLMKLMPQNATVIIDGHEQILPITQVQVGQIAVIRPGESIPVDGTIIEGFGAVDESALTGESIPVDKTVGDSVSAGTLNQAGFIRCRATHTGEDTALSQIIKTVSDAAASKAPIAKTADKVSGYFVPAVILISLITVSAWLILGKAPGYALSKGIAVLVISCPCSLGLATPVAIMVGNGLGAKNGILFKTATALENSGKVDIVVLDKTGTVTEGRPTVTDIIPFGAFDKDRLLTLAASLEVKSEHPLARAIVDRASGFAITDVSNFTAVPGNGLTAEYNGEKIFGGNLRFISGKATVSDDTVDQLNMLAKQGKTPILFAIENSVCGIIAVADVIKSDSKAAVDKLHEMGLTVVMLTGDNKYTAESVADKVGVDKVIAGILPDGKAKVIQKLKEFGKVAMVGDGINDAPALTCADTGIAIGAGTDVAIDAAEVVLMRSSLFDVPAAINLSRGTLRNIKENLFWAFFYNCIGIPVAAGVLSRAGISLSPMIAAACMSLSSFCVVCNALRLNMLKLNKTVNIRGKNARTYLPDDFEKQFKEEKKNMVRTVKIEGMMCPHCEARVKKALESIAGVESAEVSHEKGQAVVTLSGVSDELLKDAVEKADYTVLGIE